MPIAAMLAAKALMSALVCGTLRTFLGDFLSRLSGTNRMFLLTSLAVRLLMVSLLGLRGSAQSPRMNPCPSARPGEGEQEENRRGSLSAQSGSELATEDWGRPILFLLGVPGQSPRTPDLTKQSCRAATPYFRGSNGRCMAEPRNPALRELGAWFTTARSFHRKDAPKTRPRLDGSVESE